MEIFTEYGPYLGLAVAVYGIMRGLKKGFKPFFKSVWGLRITYFLPLILGGVGGLLLPLESIQSKLLVGVGLGVLAQYIHKFLSRTLSGKDRLSRMVKSRELADSYIEEDLEV